MTSTIKCHLKAVHMETHGAGVESGTFLTEEGPYSFRQQSQAAFSNLVM